MRAVEANTIQLLTANDITRETRSAQKTRLEHLLRAHVRMNKIVLATSVCSTALHQQSVPTDTNKVLTLTFEDRTDIHVPSTCMNGPVAGEETYVDYDERCDAYIADIKHSMKYQVRPLYVRTELR